MDPVTGIMLPGGHTPAFISLCKNIRVFAPVPATLDDGPPAASGIFNNIASGSYNIKVDNQQCTQDLSIDIPEPNLLVAGPIITKPVSCNTSIDGQIILSATGGTHPYTYSIDSRASQPDSIIRKLDEGNYHYTITDDHNCRIEGNAKIIKEWSECAVFVPTAFSPNGDGSNDVFRIKLQDDITDYRLAIYGRWGRGQLVYESRDPLSGWDGKYKGNGLPAGSYIWMITYTDSKGQLIKQQGSLLLIM